MHRRHWLGGVLALMLLIPNSTKAADFLSELTSLQRQLIVILEQQRDLLLAQRANVHASSTLALANAFPTVQGQRVATSTVQRGRGGSNRPTPIPPIEPPAPPVTFSVAGEGNTLTVTAPLGVRGETFAIANLTSLAPSVTYPDTLYVEAGLVGGGAYELPLSLVPETATYTAALGDILGEGEAWNGIFTVLFPSDVDFHEILYTGTYIGNDGIFSVPLQNTGYPILALVSDTVATPDTIYVSSFEATSDLPVFAFQIENAGGQAATVTSLTIDVRNIDGVAASDILDEAVLEFGGVVYPLVVGATSLGTVDALIIPPYTVATGTVRVVIAPQEGVYPSPQPISFALTTASVETDVSVAGDEVTSLDYVLVAIGLTVASDSFSESFEWLNDAQTSGRYTLSVDVTAVGGSFSIALTSNEAVSDLEEGMEYLVVGDYGTGTASAVLRVAGVEPSPSVYDIVEGEVVRLLLDVDLTTENPGTYAVSLDTIWYSLEADGVTDAQPVLIGGYQSSGQVFGSL